MTIDLHGYHPREIVWNGVLGRIIQQAWEMGEPYLYLIHGHGAIEGSRLDLSTRILVLSACKSAVLCDTK